MEIERKFLVDEIPLNMEKYEAVHMEQAYVSVKPVIRVRRAGGSFILTVKSKGLLSRQEFELELTSDEYEALKVKAEGNVIEKHRYRIPVCDTDGTCGSLEVDSGLVIELDVFDGAFRGLVYAEVEFPDEDTARAFAAPRWFGRDVTESGIYQNSALSRMKQEDIEDFVRGTRGQQD